MGTALWAIAGGLGLLLLVLAVPVSIVFRFEGIEALRARIAVRWLFGWVRLRRRVPAAAGAREPRPRAPPERGRARPPTRSGGARALGLLRQAPLRERTFRLARDLIRAARLRRLRLKLRLGLGDPADTGRLWAVLGPLGAVAGSLRGAEVRIEPEFMDPVLEFRASGRMRLVPLQLLVLVLGFALSPASLRAWRSLGNGRG